MTQAQTIKDIDHFRQVARGIAATVEGPLDVDGHQIYRAIRNGEVWGEFDVSSKTGEIQLNINGGLRKA